MHRVEAGGHLRVDESLVGPYETLQDDRFHLPVGDFTQRSQGRDAVQDHHIDLPGFGERQRYIYIYREREREDIRGEGEFEWTRRGWLEREQGTPRASYTLEPSHSSRGAPEVPELLTLGA